MKWTQRTELLLGSDKTARLGRSHVLVVGVGGVGAWAAEMLCRAGIGEMTLVDGDVVSETNINRQLPAAHSTVGRRKTDVMAQRLTDINPDLRLHLVPSFITEEDVEDLLQTPYDFVVDAIDTIAPKCALLAAATRRRLPVVSSMGAGAKTDITKIRFAPLADTFHCGLSKAVRTRLRQVGRDSGDAALTARLMKIPVVFSEEQANRDAVVAVADEKNKKTTTGTVSYMPATFGCYLAEYVLQRL